jgi:cyclophilin family peptidyl-prolyl cis-trans isomerase
MKAYLTIAHGDNTLGTLRLTLRPDIVPKTVENFVHFLTSHEASGSAATTTTSGTTAGKVGGSGYKDSSFHRIIPKFMAQGGDFINHNGTGSTSIYGPNFSDENFLLSHSQRGTLSMANSGPGTNGCQFFITFKATAHLDGRHVVFGSVDWREDDESERVLDQLERVRTDRRNDRPVERVRIVDCGVFNEDGNRGKKNAGGGELSGEKLVGEAKKNKLLQAYGEKMGGDDNPAADDDEIDLDDEEEEEQAEIHVSTHQQNKSANATGDDDEIDLDDENDEQPPAEEEEAPTGKVSSKKAALQKRLAALRTKINQSRTLNRREVHAEATRMGTDEASMKERKRQNKHDKNLKQKEYDTYVVGKLKAVGKGDLKVSADDKAEQKKLASLSEPAFDSIRKMNKRAEKQERAQHGPDDYYNPEGQYTNYERNLKNIRNNASRGIGPAAAASLDTYDPTLTSRHNITNNSSSEKDGAKRLANEMKRRAEKRNNQKRKPDFDAYDVSYINERNKNFNAKIARNFDEHTAEIRQNLERGTAL